MTIRELLRSASLILQQAGCGASYLDAELLLAKALACNRTRLIAHADDDVPVDAREAYAILIERRRRREPLAYITGEKEFWSRLFSVTPDVLIPRPETEHLIEAVLEHFPDTHVPHHFCDIGTGSGCLAVTLACEYPNATVTATDISSAALAIARANIEQHDVASRIEFRQGDMLSALQNDDGPFDAIISNPPYVSRHEMNSLAPELSHEPRQALTDDADGLNHLRTLLHQASSWLKPEGVLLMETGTCGLPPPSPSMHLKRQIHDLAGHLRAGLFVRQQT